MQRRMVSRAVKIGIGLVMNIHHHMMDKRSEKVEPSAWRSDLGYLSDVDGTWLQLQIEEWWSVVRLRMKPELFDTVVTDDHWS